MAAALGLDAQVQDAIGLDAQVAAALSLDAQVAAALSLDAQVVADLGLEAQVAAAIGLEAQVQDPIGLEAQVQDEHEEEDDEEVINTNAEHSTRNAVNLSNKQRFAVYFALEVIKSRDGHVVPEDKQLIASLLNTSVRTVERIWETAQDQIAKNQEVDVAEEK